MMHDVKVIDSVLRRGHSEEDVHNAWCEYLRDKKDPDHPEGSVHVRVGVTPTGDVIEMIGVWDSDASEWRVSHAMRPATKLIRFLGLE